MAMILPLCNCNVTYNITEMHVMPITFQLLLHYNTFLHVGYFKTLLQDYQTKITTSGTLLFLKINDFFACQDKEIVCFYS